jgi:4-hydroxy-2-oxoheptanedioate aldolase
VDAVDRIRRACDDAGIVPGIHCAGGAMAARRQEQGFRMTTLVNDLSLVRSGAVAELELLRAAQDTGGSSAER